MKETNDLIFSKTNNFSIGYPKNKTIVDFFIDQVKKSPGNIAVTCEGKNITYRQLDKISTQLANYLLSKGVQKEDLISLCIERSIEMIVAIIGIIKCGGVYLPIASDYPRERIGYILDDSKSKLVISTYDLEKYVGGFQNTEPVYLDKLGEILNNQSTELPQVGLTPNNLLYVIYTSGSTGKPKGVLIEHRNVVRLFFNDTPLFHFKETDVWCMFHSFNFDFSVWEMYGALLFGGKLIIVPKEYTRDAKLFYDLIKKEGLTIFNQTPSSFNALQETILKKEPIKTIRYVIFGGEALYPSSLKKWSEIYTWCKLINMYGITETTVHVTYKEITEKEITSNISDAGKPIPTLDCLILDDDLKAVPIGVTGELFVVGEGLARGYLNRTELTKEKFIENPFTKKEKMYRTGDLARWLPAGNIEYIGRKDFQVKIRGYRIELGEIESRLLEIEEIKHAVVLAKDGGEKGKFLVAYIIKDENGGELDRNKLQETLKRSLPEYMIPKFYVEMKKFPLTSNGKIDRNALPEPDEHALQRGLYVAPKTNIEKKLALVWQELLGIEKVGVSDNFFELGGTSLLAQKTVNRIKEKYQYEIPITKLYQFPTIEGLQNFLNGDLKNKKNRSIKNKIPKSNADIAIIGMECNFPGATTIDEFWDILKNGKETITFFKENEIDSSVSAQMKNDADYVKARGIIKDVEYFDAEFFGMSPKLVELMDPQHRLFLESSRNLLEKTGYLPDKKDGVTAVFAGCNTNTYFNNNVVWHKDKIELQGAIPVVSVNDKDYIGTRVAYQLNLNGPAVNVNSACSTSLLAIAQAVESLRAGQCDVAIAGGAAITVPVNSGHLYEEGSMLNVDGHTRSFDATATGTVFSDGVGAVLLKPLEDAEKDGDIIYAVIKGIGVNNDGGNKGSFTAPSTEGQAGAIDMAIRDANIHPSQISYIEAHGTATPLGDPIEIEGLKLAFGEQEEKQYCAIGSVKSNMGHLVHAAGVAGLIKTALSLHHKQIPPSINYTKPNPVIDFANSPFVVNDQLKDWIVDDKRIAGVSSFGVGGTNVHVILEEYHPSSQQNIKPEKQSPQIIAWSTRTENSLKNYSKKLKDFVLNNPDIDLEDIAFTLQTTRQDFAVRNALVAADLNDLKNQLADEDKLSSSANILKEKGTNIVFMFPGQGSQYVNMGKELYDTEPVYKAAIDECAEILLNEMKEDVRTVIFSQVEDEHAAEKLKNTYYTQPAIFITSYALAKLYLSWGITPNAMVGHSVGEFVAAHLAGVFSLADALKLVSSRARLIGGLPQGSMLSVRASINDIQSFLPKNISVAAINAPQLCVLSGEDSVIEKFSQELNGRNIVNKLLRTSHAFHSQMMEPVIQPLQKIVETVSLNVPRIPILSTVTANWLKDEEAKNAAYWANHTRATVNFSGAIKVIEEDLRPVFLEIGAGTTATVLTKQHGVEFSKRTFASLDTSNKTEGENISVKKALAKLWLNGIQINWSELHTQSDIKELHNLPTYSFDKKKLWVEPLNVTTLNNGYADLQEPSKTLHLSVQKTTTTVIMRKDFLIKKIKDLIESASGIDIADANPHNNFTELGLDSLLLTQISSGLKKEFKLPITFRQLNENYDTLDKLAVFLDANLPANVYQENGASSVPSSNMPQDIAKQFAAAANSGDNNVLSAIMQQLNMLTQQVASMQGQNQIQNKNESSSSQSGQAVNTVSFKGTEYLTNEEKAELKKPFGATARIETKATDITAEQKKYLDDFILKYNQKTAKSKAYTQQNRAHMADPRVVSGFKPYTKEIVYSIIVKKSKGCYLWDIDDNKYVDALNGFGSNFFGYQPDFIKHALIDQIEKGYEIGPQHELAGDVCKLICEFTNLDRAALCNTGSEAVLGAMRIARTVTNKNIIVAFTGSYHGIMDEVLVRGTKKLKTFPAASGILQDNVQNMLILDYGTDESLQIIKERADDIAAVLVEPVQSRRPEFQPVEFLKKLRVITQEKDVALIFDEVITGFRSHPGGTQALFGIKADIGTYGKIIGGGMSLGVIAGAKKYMDALDGGYWQYGDHSIPEVGVTYFAGTFVRHPLVLATSLAVLKYLKEKSPKLQEDLNNKTTQLAARLNNICIKYKIPVYIAHFSSLWKIKFKEEYPYHELLFAVMRYKNIHIWDGFPCFLTEAHTTEDIEVIAKVFEESVSELCKVGFIPQSNEVINSAENKIMDITKPPLPGARLGRDQQGNPAWFVEDVNNPGSYIKI